MKFFHKQHHSLKQAGTKASLVQQPKDNPTASNDGFMHPNFAHWNWLKRSTDS